jgi:hypothetical protein
VVDLSLTSLLHPTGKRHGFACVGIQQDAETAFRPLSMNTSGSASDVAAQGRTHDANRSTHNLNRRSVSVLHDSPAWVDGAWGADDSMCGRCICVVDRDTPCADIGGLSPQYQTLAPWTPKHGTDPG